MQDEVPTVRKIRLGKGALGSDEGEEKPEKELVGSWIRRFVFFLAVSVPFDGEYR